MKIIEIAQIPLQFCYVPEVVGKNLEVFHIANAPYYEEGFFYSSTFRELSSFIWGFRTEACELLGFFTAQSRSTTNELKKIGSTFVELEGQIRMCFTEKSQLDKVLNKVWTFGEEEGDVIFSITENNNKDYFLDKKIQLSLSNLIQVSLLTFIRGHDCAYMEIYSTGVNLEEIICKLEDSVRGQDFEVRLIDNYLETDWVKSWEQPYSSPEVEED